MAKKAKMRNAKAQKLPKREYDKVRALKEDYLQTVYYKKRVLGAWKRWEGLRSFVAFLAFFALLGSALLGTYLWYVHYKGVGNDAYYFFNVGNYQHHVYAISAKVWVAGVAAFALLGILFLIVSLVCRKKFKKYNTKSDHVDIKLDNLKREKIDSVLQNQIVVSVRSIFDTIVEYEDVLEGEEEDDEEYEYFDASEVGAPEHRTITGSVDSAIVYIDGMEVGAIDLDSEFSCFRVEPGLHSLKITIKKEFPIYGKQLILETPVNPIRIDGDYRIVLYTLLTKQKGGVIRYKLKVAEYDDMVIFMRDTREIGNVDEKHNADKLTPHLYKRAKKLHTKIYGIPVSEEERRARERELFGEETVNMEDLSKNMGSAYHDARFNRANKIEITLNQPFDRH